MQQNKRFEIPVAAAIGTFDGVHRGHKSVLEVLGRHAAEKGLQPIAITFSNHPLSIINPSRQPVELTPLWKKKKLLAEAGVLPVVLKFDEELRGTSVRDWMHRLQEEFNVKTIVVGYDTTFGCDGINMSIEDYKHIGEEFGIEVVTAQEIEGVSSSAIRKAVQRGDMEKAREMLGRPYSITSKVIHGNGLGHTIGFPTANIEYSPNTALPLPGVYAGIVKTLHDGKKYPAMVNVGKRPTVMRGDDTVVEAHVIDWKGDLYDSDITVRFLRRLRDEQKFDSIDALKKQLSKDREATLEALSDN